MDWRSLVAAVLWTLVITLAMARVASGVQLYTVWSVTAGQFALLLSGWVIVEKVVCDVHERAMREHRELNEQAVERVARRIAATLREDNVSSLR